MGTEDANSWNIFVVVSELASTMCFDTTAKNLTPLVSREEAGFAKMATCRPFVDTPEAFFGGASPNPPK